MSEVSAEPDDAPEPVPIDRQPNTAVPEPIIDQVVPVNIVEPTPMPPAEEYEDTLPG